MPAGASVGRARTVPNRKRAPSAASRGIYDSSGEALAGAPVLTLLRQKAWLIALLALLAGALATVSATALRPARVTARVSVPPLPVAALPGPERSAAPEALARRGGLVSETIRVLRLETEPSELEDRIESEFDQSSRVLDITVTRTPGQPDDEIVERLAVRVAEEWNTRLETVRTYYQSTQRRRDLLQRYLRQVSGRLDGAPPGTSGELLTSLAAAATEIGRLNERLFQLGAPTPQRAFVFQEPEEPSPWTIGYVATAFAVGAAAGALLAILALLAYSRRRVSRAGTPSW